MKTNLIAAEAVGADPSPETVNDQDHELDSAEAAAKHVVDAWRLDAACREYDERLFAEVRKSMRLLAMNLDEGEST